MSDLSPPNQATNPRLYLVIEEGDRTGIVIYQQFGRPQGTSGDQINMFSGFAISNLSATRDDFTCHILKSHFGLLKKTLQSPLEGELDTADIYVEMVSTC